MKSKYEYYRSLLISHGLDKVLERPDFDSNVINGPNIDLRVVGRYEITDLAGESMQVYVAGFDMASGHLVYNHKSRGGYRGSRIIETNSCDIIHAHDIVNCHRIKKPGKRRKSKQK
jgi:hypothetical protein